MLEGLQDVKRRSESARYKFSRGPASPTKWRSTWQECFPHRLRHDLPEAPEEMARELAKKSGLRRRSVETDVVVPVELASDKRGCTRREP